MSCSSLHSLKQKLSDDEFSPENSALNHFFKQIFFFFLIIEEMAGSATYNENTSYTATYCYGLTEGRCLPNL